MIESYIYYAGLYNIQEMPDMRKAIIALCVLAVVGVSSGDELGKNDRVQFDGSGRRIAARGRRRVEWRKRAIEGAHQ